MKADTKIYLCAILLFPALFVGILIGIIVSGFLTGFSIYKELDKWFDESEILQKNKEK